MRHQRTMPITTKENPVTPALTPDACNAPGIAPDQSRYRRFTSQKRLAAALVAVALPLGAAACSSSSTPTASTATDSTTHTAKTKHKKARTSGVKASAGGTVTQVSSAGFTMHTAKGTIISVSTTATTTYKSKHVATTAASLASGDHVRVFGPPVVSGSVTATKVVISVAHSTTGSTSGG